MFIPMLPKIKMHYTINYFIPHFKLIIIHHQ